MKLTVLVTAALILVCGGMASSLSADAKIAAAAGTVTLQANLSFADALKTLKAAKKKTTIVLRNGMSYSGQVSDVGSQMVILSNLANRDFFDAQIRIEEISAIETQVRDK